MWPVKINLGTIQSVPGAIATDSLKIDAGMNCSGNIHVSGLDSSSMHWKVS